jgi:hypothetical protein
LRQRLDRYKPTRIANGNLFKIAHPEPTVDGPVEWRAVSLLGPADGRIRAVPRDLGYLA